MYTPLRPAEESIKINMNTSNSMILVLRIDRGSVPFFGKTFVTEGAPQLVIVV